VHDASLPPQRFEWPAGFARVPDEDWTSQPLDTFGLHYDTVENHGWYRNLDPTVEDLARHLASGQVLVDYSGGTGILLDRLKLRVFDRRFAVVIVDRSPLLTSTSRRPRRAAAASTVTIGEASPPFFHRRTAAAPG